MWHVRFAYHGRLIGPENTGLLTANALAVKFETVAKAAGDGTLGITASTPAIDLSKTVEWKDGVIKKLNAGVAALLKKAKVKVIKGWAEFSDAKTCTVKTDDGDIRIHHIGGIQTPAQPHFQDHHVQLRLLKQPQRRQGAIFEIG